jgi:hypothetical protein
MGSDFGKILNRPKEMNAVCIKVLLLFSRPICPISLYIFSSDTQACFALVSNIIISVVSVCPVVVLVLLSIHPSRHPSIQVPHPGRRR